MAIGADSTKQGSVGRRYYNQPTPQLFEKPYTAPPEPKNPVLRGVALSYGASL